MQCPACGKATEIERTTARGPVVTRMRRCSNLTPHRFKTVESIPASIDDIAVRRSSTGALAGGFERQKLHDDLRAALMLRSVDEEVRGSTTLTDLVDGVIGQLVNRTEWHRPVALTERADIAGSGDKGPVDRWRLSVTDRSIVRAVDEQLESHGFEVLRILYALAVQRDDGEKLVRWRGGRDALAWIMRSFPSTRRSIPETETPARVYTWAPPAAVPLPQRVVKRNREVQEFSWSKLLHSVELTFQGRQNRQVRSEYVARWVASSVNGQRTVSSQQLASSVLDCLRRVDDIAYLRCAIAVKGLTSAMSVADEAEDLLRHPSNELRFAVGRAAAADADQPLIDGVAEENDAAERLWGLAQALIARGPR